MTSLSKIVFHVHLVQDVAVLRPLIKLAKSLPGKEAEILVASEFKRLDETGLWSAELARISVEANAKITHYGSEFEAFCYLQKHHGIVIAGSESSVPNHAVTHRLFRSIPRSFTPITLQHGVECIGFLHNTAHDKSAGKSVRFAAEIIVGWFAPERLTSIAASERSKLYVAGPPVLIEGSRATTRASAPGNVEPPESYAGMICENLHSVRFSEGNSRGDFFDTLKGLARRVHAINKPLYLRPHPAGRFTEKNSVMLEDGVVLRSEPIYALDLGRLAYGISAPSTILFDFMLAETPTAVWQDPSASVDLQNFKDLPRVSSAEDCWRFALDATERRSEFIARQARVIEEFRMPKDVRARYATLMSVA